MKKFLVRSFLRLDETDRAIVIVCGVMLVLALFIGPQSPERSAPPPQNQSILETIFGC